MSLSPSAWMKTPDEVRVEGVTEVVSTPEVPIRDVPPEPVVVVKAKVLNRKRARGHVRARTPAGQLYSLLLCQLLIWSRLLVRASRLWHQIFLSESVLSLKLPSKSCK